MLIYSQWNPQEKKNIHENGTEIQISSFKKMNMKMLSARYQPFCWSLAVLTLSVQIQEYS